MARSVFEDYEEFRDYLGFYFVAFAIFVCSGKFLTLSTSKAMPISMAMALASLGFTRFTIQIREGIAVTLVIIGATLLARTRGSAYSIQKSNSIWPSIFLMMLAALTHSGTAIFLLATLLSLAVSEQKNLQWRGMQRIKTILMAIGIPLIGAMLSSQFQQLVLLSSGDRSLDEPVSSIGQFILWSLYGVVCWWIQKNISRLIRANEYQGRLATLLATISGPITTLTLLCIYALLLTQAPTLLLVSIARMLHLLIGVSLIFIAAKSRDIISTAMVSTFLIADQARAIVEAIFIYSGVQVL